MGKRNLTLGNLQLLICSSAGWLFGLIKQLRALAHNRTTCPPQNHPLSAMANKIPEESSVLLMSRHGIFSADGAH